MSFLFDDIKKVIVKAGNSARKLIHAGEQASLALRQAESQGKEQTEAIKAVVFKFDFDQARKHMEAANAKQESAYSSLKRSVNHIKSFVKDFDFL